MTYAICFDLPKGELFAGVEDTTLFAAAIPAVTPFLEDASRFDTWEQAEAFLAEQFGAGFAAHGAVVEVDE